MQLPTNKEIKVMQKYLEKYFPDNKMKKVIDEPMVTIIIEGVSNPGSTIKYLRDEYSGEFFFWYASLDDGLHVNFSKNTIYVETEV